MRIVGPERPGALSSRWLRLPLIQTKLEVSDVDDPLERDADRAADAATRVSPSAADGIPLAAVSAQATGDLHSDTGDEENLVRRFGAYEDITQLTEETTSRIESLQGRGLPLPARVRSQMEHSFGTDFTGVRIHADPTAAESARAIEAQAYTWRNNIAFAPGHYAPDTNAGRWLLAHELAHVVQQGGASSTEVRRRPRRRHVDPAEARARAAAAAAEVRRLLTEHILFDFWAGDLRDNNNNGVVDGFRRDGKRGRDKAETSSEDGAHFGGTYHGFRTIGGLTFRGGEGGTVTTVDFNTSVAVRYRVCADVTSAAYRAGGVPVPRTRRVRELVHWFQTDPRARFWLAADFRRPFLPGDFICSFSPREGHGHAGIVIADGLPPMVVHLPGQSQHIARGIYDPRRVTDITQEPWPSNRVIFGIGRFVG